MLVYVVGFIVVVFCFFFFWGGGAVDCIIAIQSTDLSRLLKAVHKYLLFKKKKKTLPDFQVTSISCKVR